MNKRNAKNKLTKADRMRIFNTSLLGLEPDLPEGPGEPELSRGRREPLVHQAARLHYTRAQRPAAVQRQVVVGRQFGDQLEHLNLRLVDLGAGVGGVAAGAQAFA